MINLRIAAKGTIGALMIGVAIGNNLLDMLAITVGILLVMSAMADGREQ